MGRRTKVHPGTLKRVRLAVFTRDDFCCRHCGWRPDVPADYDGRYTIGQRCPEPGNPYRHRLLELDHIFPHSLGGKFVEENLQTLCNSCNARKGVRVQ